LCISAALLGLPAPIGARTLTSARLIVLPVSEITAVLQGSAELLTAFLNYALAEAQALTQEIAALKLRSSAQRLAAYLIGLIVEPNLSPARFVLPFEKRFLAAHIGCSQENLSRAFAALRRFGVETQRGIVVIRDVGGLSAYAGNAVAALKAPTPRSEEGCKA
jgi:CRP/FNR family transcriptional activator FtrB